MSNTLALLLSGGHTAFHRPSPKPHPSITPFDASDGFGNVYSDLPAEQVIPEHFADPLFMRADFGGVTLDSDRWGGLQRFKDAFLVGACSTPFTRILTPMLALYPRWLQDAVLTEHAERGYDDLIIDCEPWNQTENGRALSPDDIVAWMRYVNSWGFRVVVWRGDPNHGIDGMFNTVMQSGLVNWYIHGEEVDSRMPSAAYEASLQAVDAYIGGRIPIGVHFTAGAERHMGYPIGWPRDDYLRDWSRYDGRVHLMWQGDPTASAGLTCTSIGYYARRHVNLGQGDAALGPGAPNSRIIAFELRATEQFEGKMSEEDGCRIGWEALCAPRPDSRCRAISGFGNGARRPDGSAV